MQGEIEVGSAPESFRRKVLEGLTCRPTMEHCPKAQKPSGINAGMEAEQRHSVPPGLLLAVMGQWPISICSWGPPCGE